MKEYLKQWKILDEHRSSFLQSPRLVHVIDLTRAIFVTRNDYVFGIGDGFVGCIVKNDGKNSKKPRLIEQLSGQEIQSFDCSVYDSYTALTKHGKLFMWGFDTSRLISHSPKLVEGELAQKKVVQVSCCSYYTLALTDQGKVFFVQNASKLRDYKWPKTMTNEIGDCKAVAVACKIDFAFVLLEDGQLYGWSSNVFDEQYDDFGFRLNSYACYPVRLNGFIGRTVRQIACGDEHCIALTDSGQIYSWHLIGNDDFVSGDTPVLVDCHFKKAVKIAALKGRYAAEFDDGTLRSWGESESKSESESESDSFPPPSLCSTDCSSIDEAFAPYMWRTLDLELGPKTAAEKLDLQLDDKKSGDICFRVAKRRFSFGSASFLYSWEQQIWAHKQVLAQSLPYYCEMFNSCWIESEKTDILVEQYDYETFYAFLNYLYTGELVSNINLKCLRELSEYYGYDRLLRICRRRRLRIRRLRRLKRQELLKRQKLMSLSIPARLGYLVFRLKFLLLTCGRAG